MKLPFTKKKTNVINYTEQDRKNDSFYGQILNSLQQAFGRGGSGNFGVSPDGKRDYNALFGYGVELTYWDYKCMYERGGYAKTIVDLFPKFCWRDPAEIRFNDKPILKDELNMLRQAGFFKAMERADICNRIGQFSVLFIGIPDGLDPSLPVGSAKAGDFAGMYFNVYEEDGVEVIEWDTDPASPRYNMPIKYQLQVTANNHSKLQGNVVARVVHYSRVVHLAEGALSSKLEGVSALKAPWNALQDKEKVRGSSGEAFYRNSRQKLALETAPSQAGVKVKDLTDEARAKLKENVENFQNGFEDTLRLNNMKANMLQPSIASPRDTFDIATEDVAGACRIPVRYLTTKAGGTVTGSEDKAALNGVVKDRQEQECTVWLLESLQIMDEAGLLVLPEFSAVKWPVQSALTEKEAAEATASKAKAFNDVATGLSTIGGDSVIAKSAYDSVGLSDIETDDIDLSNDNEEV